LHFLRNKRCQSCDYCDEAIFDGDYAPSENIYTITDEAWGAAKSKLTGKYGSNSDLPGVLGLLGDFEKVNNKTIYKSSLKQFIRESKLFGDRL